MITTDEINKADGVCPECDAFTGHKRLVCRGESNRPLNGPHSTNSYRSAWGLDPIGELPEILIPSRQESRTYEPRIAGGVGTELSAILKWFGQYPKGNCNCVKYASHMDSHGIAWCERNIDTILGWLTDEAKQRTVAWVTVGNIPGFEWTARAAVEMAISKAKINAAKRKLPAVAKPSQPFQYEGYPPTFITTAQLMKDAHKLASMLPADTPFIIGIARSGLCVATMVAMLLHLPLKIFRQSEYDLIDGGNGWRLSGNIGGKGSPVVIDDTVMSGNSFKHCMPVIHKQFPNAISAAVYVNPASRVKPTMWAVDLPWPHLLEWNLFNSVLSPHLAYDFDGILCHDCPHGSDDDGTRYAEFLRDTKPLYLCRRTSIPLIVTARLEKYRPQTMDWLLRHGVAVQQLIMGPWTNNRERARSDVAEYKAKHYREFLSRRHAVKPPLFIESEPAQAQRIAELSGGIVICPAAGRCYP